MKFRPMISQIFKAANYLQSNPLLPLEPVYKLIKPERTTLTVGETNADFLLKPAHLAFADFRDDFQNEKEIIRKFLSDIETIVNESSDPVFADIGANIGLYSCFAGSHIEDLQVTSFEPHPPTANILIYNHQQNNIDGEVHEVALGSGFSNSKLTPHGETAHNLYGAGNTSESFDVEIKPGDYFFGEDTRVPLAVKIDVEGAEVNVLRGMEETLNHSECRLIYCEVHPEFVREFGDSPGDVDKLLSRAGFKTTHFNVSGNRYHVRGLKDKNTS